MGATPSHRRTPRSALRAVRRRAVAFGARLPRPDRAVCDDLATWAAGHAGAERWAIDAPFTTTRPLPYTTEPQVDESFTPLCSYPVPERALVKIPRARIRCAPAHPDQEVGLVVLPTGEFVGELVALTPDGRRSMLRPERSFRDPVPANPPRREGNFYAFLGFGARHYYHWSHDLVMGLRDSAALLPPDTQLIVPDDLRAFQAETLALLGLDAHPRLPFAAGECWEVENLYVVTPKLKTQIDSPEPFRWFRDAAKRRYGIAEGRPSRRLYLTRRDDGHWRTTNEAEVEACLGAYGFETVAPGDLSFREQIQLFSDAEVIVGTGAGLFNMVFAAPGAKVLQFQEPSQWVHALWTTAAASGVEYHYVLCDSVPGSHDRLPDIHVPIDKLHASLGAMGVDR